ncbi:MAG: hypothetical protein QOI98_434, partial [Solirubrobacteraceae bacterium]|nr:hypothetical protein [Solirubrobacteraceae bacterium]
RGGEYLYQDFLYDDHGAAGAPDPNTPYGAGPFLFASAAGTFTYPTDPVYALNAADLVEFRVKPLADATAFRVTLSTMKDASRTAFTIALGSGAAHSWPHGAGVSSPAQLFLTVHGSTAELVDAATGAAKSPAPSASVDMTRRQIDVRVPHAAWDPGREKVRMTVGVGLWDTVAGSYLAPAAGSATQSTPGGAAPTRAAIVNVGPRFSEAFPEVSQYGAGVTIGDAAVGGTVQSAWWRERGQADALRLGDVSAFHADVDFAKLAAGTEDDSAVPKTGPINRILPSAYQFGQGLDPTKVCYDLPTQFSAGAKCIGRFVGQLQSYSLYVPRKPEPRNGWGMTLLLHSLSANYNQYSASNNQSQLGERGAGSLVLTPGGRGPDGFYAGIAEADTFEAWADVARHYKLDPDWSVVSGYSMGGFGTYRLLARWPDLFARGFSTVGVPGTVDDQLASLRNTPLMAWNATADELVNIQDSEAAEQALAAIGLRFIEHLFLVSDHLTLATNDEYGPAAAFLGTHRVDRSPPHVSYVVDPHEDSADAKAVADHAYWVSDIRLRDAKAAPTGTFDARSEAFGVGDAKPLGVTQGAGALTGGAHGPMAFVERAQDWGPAPATTKADRLVVKTTNIASATVDASGAHLSCSPGLDIRSDAPLALRIACPVTRRKSRCATKLSIRLPRVRGQRVVLVTVMRGHKRVKRVRGRNLRRVTVSRATRAGFSLRIYLKTSGKGKRSRRIVVARRIAPCARRAVR